MMVLVKIAELSLMLLVNVLLMVLLALAATETVILSLEFVSTSVLEMQIVLMLATQDVNLNEVAVWNVMKTEIALLLNGEELKKQPRLVVTPTLVTNVFLLPLVKLMKIVVDLILLNNILLVHKDKISVLSVPLMFTVPTDQGRPVLSVDKNVLFVLPTLTVLTLTLSVMSELTSVPGLLVLQ